MKTLLLACLLAASISFAQGPLTPEQKKALAQELNTDAIALQNQIAADPKYKDMVAHLLATATAASKPEAPKALKDQTDAEEIALHKAVRTDPKYKAQWERIHQIHHLLGAKMYKGDQ